MKNIILIGNRATGKTTVGRLLALKMNIQFIDSDKNMEKYIQKKFNKKLTVREIYLTCGSEYFEKLESISLINLNKDLKNNRFILSCGGKTPLIAQNRKILKKMGIIIFLNTAKNILLKRILKDGIPATFPYQDDPQKSLKELLLKRLPVYQKLADHTIKINSESPGQIVKKILNLNL